MQLAPESAVREKATEFLGFEMPDAIWELAYQAAIHKLTYIVGLYGDLDGLRRGASYLGKLAQEYILSRALSAFCAAKSAEKKTASEEDGLHDTNSISGNNSKCQTEKECAI